MPTIARIINVMKKQIHRSLRALMALTSALRVWPSLRHTDVSDLTVGY